jgi:hypothetical protein
VTALDETAHLEDFQVGERLKKLWSLGLGFALLAVLLYGAYAVITAAWNALNEANPQISAAIAAAAATLIVALLCTLVLAGLYWLLARWTRGHKEGVNAEAPIILRASIGTNLLIFVLGMCMCAVFTTALIHSPELIPTSTSGWIQLVVLFLVPGFMAIKGGCALVDRSGKLRIDQSGICDLRSSGQYFPWADVVDIKLGISRRSGVVVVALLHLVMKAGDERYVGIDHLDEEPEWVFEKARAMWLGWSQSAEPSAAGNQAER